jgi:EGF-like domain
VWFAVFWLQEQKCCESALLARGARLTNRPLRLAAIRHAATESRLHPRGIHSTHAGAEPLPGRGAKHGNGLPQGEGEVLLCRLHSKGKSGFCFSKARELVMNRKCCGFLVQLEINSRPIRLLASALSGVNVVNCAHPCSTRPCANGGHCVPDHEFFYCECAKGFKDVHCGTPVSKVTELAIEVLPNEPVPQFAGHSYLHFTDQETIKR